MAASFFETTFFAVTPSGTFSSDVSRYFYFCTVAIILGETVEFVRNHSFNQVLFAQPFQFTIDFRHKVSNLFLVYFYFFEIINNLNQLLLTDSCCCWHFSDNEFFADNPFNFSHLSFFTEVDDGNGSSCFSGTSCTSAAMCITLCIVW